MLPPIQKQTMQYDQLGNIKYKYHCCDLFYSDSRVRGRVSTFLRAHYKTLEEAEEAYHLTLSDCLADLTVAGPKPRKKTPAVHEHVSKESSNNGNQSDVIEGSLSSLTSTQVLEALSSINDENLKQIADASFLKLALRVGIDTNPGNFATLSVQAMKLLQSHGKNNLLYKFAYCIATTRPGSEEALFPFNRMPFGLVEYQIEFFSCTNIIQVGYFCIYLQSFITYVHLIFSGRGGINSSK